MEYEPVKTAKAIKYAVLHPRHTAVNIYNTAQSRYNEFINSDDGYRRGEIFGETVADVAQIVAFGKPNKNVTKTSASNMDRAARGSIEAVKRKGLHRPYIRKSVRQTVEDRGKKTVDSKWRDANTNEGFDGKYDLGHKPGYEFRTMKRWAEEKGMTQKEFNDYMNNPDFYQIENPSLNRNRRFELK